MNTEIDNPSVYAMPKPTRLLLLDDVSRGNSVTAKNIQRLSQLIDSPNLALYVDQETLVYRLRQKYDKAITKGQLKPLDLAISLGKAGEDVASSLAIPVPIIRINPTRKVKENGLPEIISKTGIPFEEEIKQGLDKLTLPPTSFTSVGIVDDTIFFGGTMNTAVTLVKKIFPIATLTALTLTYASPFAKENLQDIPVIAGLELRTTEQNYTGINSIDAKDFFQDDALPLQNGDSIPFMKEENWMRAWFGKNYGEAYTICEQLKQEKTYE